MRLQSLAIQSFYNDLRRCGHKRRAGGLSEQTILHIHKVLSAALQQAVRWRLISYNPATDVKPPRPARVEMLTFDVMEMKRLLSEAEGTRLFALTMVGLTTGLRRGELLGLSWRDLDFERGRLTVNRTLEETGGGLVLKAPKTRQSVRRVPLPQVALEALRRHELQQKEERLAAGSDYSDDGLVFPDPLGRLQKPRNFTKAFGELVKRSGVRHITVHGLRHTHITELLRAGVHPKVVSERAGHSSVAFTLQRYAHALPDMQQDAADQTQKLVGNLLNK
jgi:integrase